MIITFDNGFKIIYTIIPNIKLVRIGILNKNGQLQENRKNLEISHFFEHLAGHFLSSKYPDGKANLKNLERLGAESNATTSDYFVNLWIEGKAEYWKNYLDYLLEVYLHFQIDPTIFVQEKRAVINELQQLLNIPFRKHSEVVAKKTFTNFQSSAPLYDRIENSLKLQPADCIQFFNTFWIPEETALYISGDFELMKLIHFCKGKFKRHPKITMETNYPIIDIVARAAVTQAEETIKVTYVKDEKVQNSRLTVIYDVPFGPFDDQKRSALMLVRRLLSAGFDSRLVKILRSQLGLVYSVDFDINLCPETSELSTLKISTDVESQNLTKVLKILIRTIKIICDTEISADEFEKVRNRVETDYLHRNLMCNLQFEVLDNAQRVLYGNTAKTSEQVLDDFLKVSKSQIMNVCKQIFTPENMSIIYSGATNLNRQIVDSLKFEILNRQN